MLARIPFVGIALLSLPAFAPALQGPQKITAPDGLVNTNFGETVRLTSGRALVASRGYPVDAQRRGKIYVFDGVTGAFERELVDPVTGMDSQMGSALAVDGDLAYVGVERESSSGQMDGFILAFDVTTGQMVQEITGPTDLDEFQSGWGSSIEVSEGYLVTGFGWTSSPPSAIFYVVELATGQTVATLTGPTPQVASTFFGNSLAFSGDRAVVGAAGVSEAYVFEIPSGALLTTLTPFHQSQDDFAYSLAIDDDWILVGERWGGHPVDRSGAVYVFERDTFQFRWRLTPEDYEEDRFFGMSLEITDGIVAVGAAEQEFTPEPFVRPGAVYLMEIATRKQLAKFTPKSLTQLTDPSGFGQTVAYDGNLLLAGAYTGFTQGTVVNDAAYLLEADARMRSDSFCFGVNCPCGNDDSKAGCINRYGDGAELVAVGTSRVGVDDAVLIARKLPDGQAGFLFMGDVQIPPAALGDGLRCVGGTLYRYLPPTLIGSDRQIVLGPDIVGQSCASFPAAGCITAGSSWYFQSWYRDPGTICNQGSNLTNGVQVIFTP